jgi:hypothetical protein
MIVEISLSSSKIDFAQCCDAEWLWEKFSYTSLIGILFCWMKLSDISHIGNNLRCLLGDRYAGISLPGYPIIRLHSVGKRCSTNVNLLNCPRGNIPLLVSIRV